MGVKPQKGDWIIGTSPISQGNKLVYAMQVSESIPFEKYYSDVRFEKKKPVVHGSWRERCGDNMYYKDQEGKWMQHRSIHHRGSEIIKKDLKHPNVFIAENFHYFGKNEIAFPVEFQELIWKRQGCKCSHNPEVVENFLKWLKTSFNTGILGNPKDNDESKEPGCDKPKTIQSKTPIPEKC
jgi:hypothetical protein